jgi:hypothetical protein
MSGMCDSFVTVWAFLISTLVMLGVTYALAMSTWRWIRGGRR